MVYSDTIELKDNVSGPAAKAAGSMNILQQNTLKAQNVFINVNQTFNAMPKPIIETGKASDDTGTALAGLASASAAVVAAVGALAIGLGAGIFAAAKFAVECSEGKNAAISLWDALGQGAIKGEEVDEMLDDMRSSLGLTKDSMAPMASAFLKMGITGKDALTGLTKAAMSAEALGKGGGEAFTTLYQKIDMAAEAGGQLAMPMAKLQKSLVSVGLNATDMSAAMGMSLEKFSAGMAAGTIDARKFGDAMTEAVTKKGIGPMQKLANSSANLGGMLKEYIGDMFEDMGNDIAPMMAEVKSFFDVFSQAKPSGQAMKAGIVGVLKEVFAQATKVIPVIKHIFLDIIIYSLKAYIGIKPLVKSFLEFKNSATGMMILSKAFSVLKGIIVVVAVAVGVVVAAFAALWIAAMAMVTGVYVLAASIQEFIQGAAGALVEWVSSAATAAYNFVAGLVGGITGGAGQVVDAVKGLANGATNAFKSALGISSPSKVMMQMGSYAGEGAALGVESASGDMASASEGLAAAASGGLGSMAAPTASSAPATSGASAGMTINATINIEGGSGGSAAELTEQAVVLIFERIAKSAGV
jgi:phage-related protein